MNDDLRLGQLIVPFDIPLLKESKTNDIPYDIVLMGFASDQGCGLNGGRLGAADAPDAVRHMLKKTGSLVNPELRIDIRDLRIADFGNVKDYHDGLQNVVSVISENSVPIIVGGSNDQSFPNALGLLTNYPDLDVVNIDAHLDVRPGTGHSGSPFQELLCHEYFHGSFHEFACQGNQCSVNHVDWAKSRGTQFHWLSQITESSFPELLQESERPLFVSFDVDSIRASDCPGVSCPGTRGLSADMALSICFQAGACSRVVALDLSELNPRIESNISVRLVCQMIYYFIMGYRTR